MDEGGMPSCSYTVNVILSAMLTDAFRETTIGIPIWYRLMENFLISDVYNPSPKSKKMLSKIFSLLMTVHLMLQKNKICNRAWTNSHPLVKILALLSAQRRRNWGIMPAPDNSYQEPNMLHSSGSETASRRTFHLPQQHILSLCQHRWWVQQPYY